MNKDLYVNTRTLVCSIHEKNVDAWCLSELVRIKIKEKIFTKIINMPLDEYYIFIKGLLKKNEIN